MAVLVSAALSLLAHASPVFGWLDRFSHFAPFYFVVGALGAIAALFEQRLARVFLGGAATAALLASGALLAPEFLRPRAPEPVADLSKQIKVIQLNAQLRNTDVRRVAGWLKSQDADIITVTEARHDLRDLLTSAGWRSAGAGGSLMIFTREPYVGMTRPRTAEGSKPTFVNATYLGSVGTIEVVTTHMDRTAANAMDQVETLTGVASERPRDRMILTGDFNATPWSFALRQLDKHLGLIRRDRAVPTWPAEVGGHRWRWPLFPIDHIYAGPAWVTIKAERGPWVGSDHYPLIVTLAPAATR